MNITKEKVEQIIVEFDESTFATLTVWANGDGYTLSYERAVLPPVLAELTQQDVDNLAAAFTAIRT
jgi:hypothetical protein